MATTNTQFRKSLRLFRVALCRGWRARTLAGSRLCAAAMLSLALATLSLVVPTPFHMERPAIAAPLFRPDAHTTRLAHPPTMAAKRTGSARSVATSKKRGRDAAPPAASQQMAALQQMGTFVANGVGVLLLLPVAAAVLAAVALLASVILIPLGLIPLA